MKIDQQATNWQDKSMKEIIGHIHDNHHVTTKEILEELNFLAFKILKVHYKDHGEQLLKVHRLVGLMKTELEAHLVKEEEDLFPMIMTYEVSGDAELLEAIGKFIQGTEAEHKLISDLFEELKLVTNDFRPPAGACNAYRKTFNFMDVLDKDICRHFNLESNVLFTRLKQ